jgi:5-methylcytosine-specific restriction endonuclease McrA
MTKTAEEPRISTSGRWKGQRLLTKAEKLERQRARSAVWRKKNQAKLLDYFRRYRAEHPELKAYFASRYRAQRHKWVRLGPSTAEENAKRNARRAANREKVNEERRAYYAANIDRIKATARRSRQRNAARKREIDRRYRMENPEAYKAGIARAKAAKPDLYKQIQAHASMKRRARKKEAAVERVSLQRVLHRDRDICHLCGRLVVRSERSFDHLIPVVRLGAHAEWNLMLAHNRCNKRRSTKQILPEETREAAEAYIAARARVEVAA